MSLHDSSSCWEIVTAVHDLKTKFLVLKKDEELDWLKQSCGANANTIR